VYVVSVLFEIKQEHFQDFKLAVIQQASNSLDKEPGCQRFDVCESCDDNSNQIYLYEIYTNETAFQFHLKSTHFKVFDALVTPWLESKSVSVWGQVEV
jgi:autoinducer 2-degrading protein